MVGDQAAMKQTEADILNHLHASDQQSSDEKETALPPKKRWLGLKMKYQGTKKEKSKQSKKKQTRQDKQKSSTFQLEIGSLAKDSPGKDLPGKGSRFTVHNIIVGFFSILTWLIAVISSTCLIRSSSTNSIIHHDVLCSMTL